jgi:hypothetical protein
VVRTSLAVHQWVSPSLAAPGIEPVLSWKEVTGLNDDLHRLYDATAEDMLYGIGLTRGTCEGLEGQATPTIAIAYPHWSRQQLELVRGAFGDGLTITVNDVGGQARHIYLATRQLVTVSVQRGVETDVLRAPAWDARLEGVEREAFGIFQRGRRALGGFLLLMQTCHWEFMTGVDEISNIAKVGVIVPRTTLIPSTVPSERSP